MLAHPTIDLRAGDRAGEIAAAYGARLIVATAYIPAGDTRGSWAVPPGIRPNPDPKGEGYMLSGNAPIYAILWEAHDRAKATGTKDIEERPIVGDAVHALVDLAEEVHADLLVVGNVGLSTIAGRLLGSVLANVARRSKTDVLIVHTTP
ncbi:MAG TPA: universal stress protein [Mycobacterium sp.]|nr:universal stress protein [Mycobacterium sp.]